MWIGWMEWGCPWIDRTLLTGLDRSSLLLVLEFCTGWDKMSEKSGTLGLNEDLPQFYLLFFEVYFMQIG